MGFPMIQVFMIAARQVSKPIADAVLQYGKNHPIFRNRLLIPIGRGLVRFTARMRMKRLGLGEPVTHAPVSEAAALEQASDFVQQLVLFSYSVGVFAGYYFYTKVTSPETVKSEEFVQYKEQQEQIIKGLRYQIETLEQRVAAQSKRSFLAQLGVMKDKDDAPPPPPQEAATTRKSENSTETKQKTAFQRISSLPIDAAASLILDDEEYLMVRRGTSIGFEQAAKWAARGEGLRYREAEPTTRRSSAQLMIEEAAGYILGQKAIL